MHNRGTGRFDGYDKKVPCGETYKNSRRNLSFFLANGRNVKIGVDKWPRKRYYATIQGGHAIENRGKEKISDEEAERRDDDVYGDVHVPHVHVSSRPDWSTDFP